MMKSKTDTSIMKAEVMPSQRLNEDTYRPWIAVKSCGTVVCAHCNCMAGLAESCTHIGAILFKVEAAVRLGYTREACTDQVCKWNDDFVKKVKPARIYDIAFYSKPTKSKRPGVKRTFSEATVDEKTSFLDKLKRLAPTHQPVGLSLFHNYASAFHHTAPVPVPFKLPPILRSFHVPGIKEDDIDAQINRILSLEVTAQQKDYIETSTKLQNSSLVWKDMRVGRITASVAHDVLHTNQDTPCYSVMQKVCFPSGKTLTVPSVKWGNDNEKLALSDYMEQQRNLHKNLRVVQLGLCLSEAYHFLGASADSVALCDCHGKWLVEIKCTFKHKDADNIGELLADTDFCINTEMKLKEKHKYMTQVQMQLFAYDLNVCHFVNWTPKLCFGVEVQRKPAFIDAISTLVTFYAKHIARELVTRAIEHKAATVASDALASDAVNASVYCYCRQPYKENEEMIGCDNDHCTYKWIHFSCAKLKRAPKGSWYCKYCRKSKTK